MQLVKADILDVVFATRILQGIILGLLVDVTIKLSSTLKPKLIIRSAIKSILEEEEVV
jgi:hypothetical protein